MHALLLLDKLVPYGQARNLPSLCQKLHNIIHSMQCRVVNVEKMSLAEQVELYSSAQILVMTHGASIANILFMSPVRLQSRPNLFLVTLAMSMTMSMI